MRMAVVARRLAVGGPSGVCNTGMRVKDLGHVDARVVNQLSELGNLAHLFECEDFISLVTVDSKTGRIVTSVFEASKAWTDTC